MPLFTPGVSVGDGVWWWPLDVLDIDALVPTCSQIVSNYLVGKFFLKKTYLGSMQMHLKPVGVSSLSLNIKKGSVIKYKRKKEKKK